MSKLSIKPSCYFAQEKIRSHRLLPGAIINSNYREYFNGNAEFNYCSDFEFNFEGLSYFFLFDFRYFYSLKEIPVYCMPTFRIKEFFFK